MSKVGGQRQAPVIGDALVEELLHAGHGLGIHPFMETATDVGAVADRFGARFGHRPVFARNHHIAWSGFVDVPQIAAKAGVVMNFDSMPVCTGDGPCAGFVGGSGRPMRFIDEQGKALPILQQTTTIDDYSLRVRDAADRSAAVAALVERTVELSKVARAAGQPVIVNAHPSLAVISPEWLEPLLAGRSAGVPVVAAEAWLAFVTARRSAQIDLKDCANPKITLPEGVELRASK